MRFWKQKKGAMPNGMAVALKKACDLWSIQPDCVIDVGAASGKWSLCAEQFWPHADYLLLEPLEENRSTLTKLTASRNGWRYIQAAVGSTMGEVVFSVSPDLDGSAVYDSDCGFEQRTVPITTLDNLKYPHGSLLLKLDTHGYEVPIFQGAIKTLERVALIVVEVYGQRITAECLLFYELCNYLADRGFRPIDIVDVMHRPSDRSFWQADLFFLRKEHPVFADHHYH
jgi:FkbM family methyltransferase